uniref:Myosin H n=1 Tax=Toxoplasma gondii TgCATBr9 TaxID=943120 RepID=A0A2T6IPH7_TOXGO|nr:myosin H [Toxoplasma gondii TgCATBr9]
MRTSCLRCQKDLRQVKARMLMKKAAAIGYAGIGGLRWKAFMISHRKIRAAIKIQSNWRRHAAQKVAKKLRYERLRNNAATDIQRVWRGYLGRLRVQLMRLLTPYAVTIQVRQTKCRETNSTHQADVIKLSTAFHNCV